MRSMDENRRAVAGRDGNKRMVPSKAARAACEQQTTTACSHTMTQPEPYA